MNALEELTEDRIDRSYVERRIEDWKQRIEALYADVSAWLPDGWTATGDGGVLMHEELMRRFKVPERRLPVLSLRRNAMERGKMEPRGLWIIGANGRVDLILPDRHYLFVDRSESFEAPDWQISNLVNRLHPSPFTGDSLRKALE